MALWPGGVWTWTTMFVAHWAGVHWRMLDVVRRDGWAFAVNALGLFIWAYSTIAISVALGAFYPSMALEIVVNVFCFWVLIRTGLTEELVTA